MPARPEHPQAGELRAGQQPEPAPPGPLRRGPGLPALTFANLDRARLAGEVLDVLGPRAKTEAVAPGPPRPAVLGRAEPVAVEPRSRSRRRRWSPWPSPGSGRRRPSSTRAVDWLLAHRAGHRLAAAQGQGARPWPPWRPIYGQAQGAEDRYRLVVTVNDTEVYRARRRRRDRGQGRSLVPAQGAQGRRHEPRPVRHRGPGHVRLRRHPHRLHPRLRPRPGPGRTARPGSTAGSTGRPTPSSTARPCRPASASRSTRRRSRTRVSQVALGGKARVGLDACREQPAETSRLGARLPGPRGAPARRHDPDRGLGRRPRPARTTLADGVLTFYFAPDQ